MGKIDFFFTFSSLVVTELKHVESDVWALYA